MAKNKNKKKHGLDIQCPFCGTKVLVHPKNQYVKKDGEVIGTKVKRFPKTHMIKFDCGFAFLYNTKTNNIFTDIDWSCTKNTVCENKVYKKFLEDVREAFHAKKK